MSQCLNFNGFPLFEHLTDIMIKTNAFTALSGGSEENTWESGKFRLNFALLLRLLFSCTVWIEFSCELGQQNCLSPPRSDPTISWLRQHSLAKEQIRISGTGLRSLQLHSTHHFLSVVHEVFSRSLLSILDGTCSTTLPASQDSSNFVPNFLCTLNKKKTLQWNFAPPTVCVDTSFFFASVRMNSFGNSSMFHLHTGPRIKYVVDPFADFLFKGSLPGVYPLGCSCNRQQSAECCRLYHCIITWRPSRMDINFFMCWSELAECLSKCCITKNGPLLRIPINNQVTVSFNKFLQ